MTHQPHQLNEIRPLDAVFERLQTSAFRQKFHLGDRERDYLQRKGMTVILQHAADFIDRRLAAANPPNDGKQTPLRNHPVFIAQHATGTCCRGCLERWHGIPQGRQLAVEEQRYIVAVIERWLQTDLQRCSG